MSKIRYFRTEENAHEIGIPTVYGPISDSVDEFNDIIGEVHGSRVYRPSQNIYGCNGRHFLGNEAQWQGIVNPENHIVYPDPIWAPIACQCPDLGPCPYVPFTLEKKGRIVVSGATGGATAANGTWDSYNLYPEGGACLWFFQQPLFTGTSRSNAYDASPNGIGVFVKLTLVGAGGGTVEYTLEGLTSTEGEMILPKTFGGSSWPPTITLTFVNLEP